MYLRSISRAALMTAIPVFGLAAVAAASPVGYQKATFAQGDEDSGTPLGLVVDMQAFAAATPQEAAAETSLAGRGLTLRDGTQASFVVSNALSGKISAWNGLLPDTVPFAILGDGGMTLPEGTDSAGANANGGTTGGTTSDGSLASGGFAPRANAALVSGVPTLGDSVGSALTQNAFGDLAGGAIAGTDSGPTVNGFNPVTGTILGALPSASSSSGGSGFTPGSAADPDTTIVPLADGPGILAEIPEPGTIALLGIGLAALAVSRKRLSA